VAAHWPLVVVTGGDMDAKRLEGALASFKSGGQGRVAEVTRLSAKEKADFLQDVKDVEGRASDPLWASLEAAKAATLVTFRWHPEDASALAASYGVAATISGWPSTWTLASDVDRLLDTKAFSELAGDAARKPPRAPLHFVNQVAPEEDGSLTLQTSGTERFGLRTLRLSHITRSSAKAMSRLVNLLVQRWVEGQRPAPDGTLDLSFSDLVQTEARKAGLAGLLPGAKGRVRVAGQVVGAEHVVQLTFPDASGQTDDERREHAIDQLLGTSDSASSIDHSAALLEVSRKSRERLIREVKPRVLKRLRADELLLVKAPFECDKGTEWMWVEVQSWKGTRIHGSLQSNPECATGLRAGQAVDVSEADLFDYMEKFLDGSFIGNDTGKLLHPEFFEELDGGRRRLKE
jgi:uncharacterized protein YegJ (DUF2314 family)